jgi:transcriptional regulator with XRE-family HTH domain
MPTEPQHTVKLFGQAIRKRRNELGISQESLAETAGLHRTYVADIERGTRNLSLVNIFKLADALGMRVGTLFSEYVENETGKNSP